MLHLLSTIFLSGFSFLQCMFALFEANNCVLISCCTSAITRLYWNQEMFVIILYCVIKNGNYVYSAPYND